VTSELPTDEARISGLVEGFISAFNRLVRSNVAAADARLLALQPQLFAQVTQSFVDFGNLVSAALPEIFDQAGQAPRLASDQSTAKAADKAVGTVVEMFAEDAGTHAGTIGSLADALAEHIRTLDAPAPQLEPVLAAVRGIEDYWREVVAQLQAVPGVLSSGDPGKVAELRALAPIWDRVSDKVNEVQQTQQAPVALASAPSLKAIDGGKEGEP